MLSSIKFNYEIVEDLLPSSYILNVDKVVKFLVDAFIKTPLRQYVLKVLLRFVDQFY